MTIPKTIHYCWLSGNPIPAAYQKYMSLWKTKLPDYQFMLWDTKRFDINKTTWTKQAFDAGLYAFAADYIRLFAIYNYGGIYLDMDIEIIKPFDDLLNTDLMIAYENHISENLEAGCFGAIKGHEYIKKCMEYFETTDFFDPSETGKIMGMSVTERSEYLDPIILPEIMKRAMENFKDKKYRIYPREYFTAKNIVTGAIEKTRNTFAVHHFATQYHSDEWRKNRKTEQAINRAFGEKTILSKIVRKILGIKNRITRQGIGKAIEYYFNKYVVNKNNRKKADT
ncbi:MAG: glycosyl transferase [Spirochaetaceae bacterium]|jgi:mannosyltransferase OCH1-like enzyme|nr:glycosyl transferase [Spirochaetaceae bacterium]